MDSLSSRFTQIVGAKTIEQCRDIEELRKLTIMLWQSNAALKSMVGMMLIQGIKPQLQTPSGLDASYPGDEQSERHG